MPKSPFKEVKGREDVAAGKGGAEQVTVYTNGAEKAGKDGGYL